MWLLITYKKLRTLAYIYAISMALSIIFGFIFVPRTGAIAVVWITIFSESIVLLLSSLVLIKVFRNKDNL